MAGYCKKRSELFTISVFLGAGVSTVAFKYQGDQIASNFDLAFLREYRIVLLALTYLLPALIFYLSLYLLNGFLIRLFAKANFDDHKKRIMRSLVEARLGGESVDADPSDLVEECAWTSLSKYWR